MKGIDQSVINQIIDQVDIVEEISKDIALTKKGANFVGLCPFHDDNNPSFIVSPTKKICNCFVCKQGGNVINFRQKYNNISYFESVKLLASQIGIEVKEAKDNNLPIHYVNQDICDLYHNILTVTNEGSEAKKYLIDRGMDDTIINRHQLGFSAKSIKPYDYLIKKSNEEHKYSEFDIVNSNIFNDNHNDMFVNRLVIPIKNDINQVVGFSGRILSGDSAKYINSRESDVFKKKDILYNLNNAKHNLVNDKIIIVEGFFDVYSYEQQGIYNVVASMGTAITNNHIRLLKKYNVKEIVLSLDQDKAGVEATLKLIKELNDFGFYNIRVVVFDDYKDVDEYVQAGNDANDLITNAIEAYQFKLDNMEVNIGSDQEVISFINDVFTNIKVDKETLPILITKVSKKVGYDRQTVKEIIEEVLDKDINSMDTNNNHDYYQEPSYQINNVANIDTSLDYYDSFVEEEIIDDEIFGPKPVSVDEFGLSDDYVYTKLCFTREGFNQVKPYLEKNPSMIKNQQFKEIIDVIEKMYQSDETLDAVNPSLVCDLLSKDVFNLVSKVSNLEIDENQVSKLLEQNDTNLNSQLSKLTGGIKNGL